MASAMRNSLLKSAIALVPTHGFTRQAISSAAASLPEPHAAPLSEAGMNALFGTGDDARRTLIKAWLEDAEGNMVAPGETGASAVKVALGKRLRANEPVLHLLPETFALLAAPQTRIGRWTFPAVPVLDPRPGFEHAFNVAHRACLAAGDKPDGAGWYTSRAAVAAIYAASELHQMRSPVTAHAFMSSLVDRWSSVSSTMDDASVFGSYMRRSWGGIFRSLGIF